jgi:formate hydrogenlyase subunit 3/multisubunit Na+/H+ antiporter MnhD subunit
VQALRQPRLKPMIAYSTVAQLGYLMIALPLAGGAAAGGALTAAVLLAASHAAAKAAMFLCAGSLLAAYGHDRIDALAGDRAAQRGERGLTVSELIDALREIVNP